MTLVLWTLGGALALWIVLVVLAMAMTSLSRNDYPSSWDRLLDALLLLPWLDRKDRGW